MDRDIPHQFQGLAAYLNSVPGTEALSADVGEDIWWLKLAIDIQNPLAWSVVQEFGHVLNYLSLDEKLPTTFKPVSPPPYMNGGPSDFLSWVIECPKDAMTPDIVAKWLEGRLPRPVDDLENWDLED